MKTPYLFTSDNLLMVLSITTSVKTKLMFISIIGPRLIDPKAKPDDFLKLFRYSSCYCNMIIIVIIIISDMLKKRRK